MDEFEHDSNFDAVPDAPAPHMRGRLASVPAVLAFVRAGKATITLMSKRTGMRFTYRINQSDDKLALFVNVLVGPDNAADYKYLGRIARDIFWIGRKVPRPGDIGRDAPSAKAFDWAWQSLVKGAAQGCALPDQLEVWHEGRCGRCGRKLTVPESIATGFGPECQGKL
jgi:hypothetical protein